MTSIDELLNIESDDIGDIKSWINKVISSETSDKELKDLIMKLQFVSQDIDKSLDRLQDQLTHSIPSLKQILSDISSESISLKQDFIRINHDVSIIHERNQNVIGNLSSVHAVSNDMNLCIDSLSEIHNWETKIRKVNKLFDNREFELISKELKLMKSRVEMLKNNMPKLYNTRNIIVENYITKLENMVIPYINQTFDKHDYRSFIRYEKILININKYNEINKLYILNRLETIKQLLQHFSNKNNKNRLQSLNIWFTEFLLNLLSYFEDEYEWTQQVNIKLDVIKELIVNICDEISIEIREWIVIYMDNNQDMDKLINLFQICNELMVNVYNSRLLITDVTGYRKHKKKDILELVPNINKLISNLLSTHYKKTYLNLEKVLLFDAISSPKEKQNDLSFTDIIQRADEWIEIFMNTLSISHKRCIIMSYGSLIKQMIALYDAFIVEYINKIHLLLESSRYDPSNMVSPYDNNPEVKEEDGKDNNNDLAETQAANNWIIDLKQAFSLAHKLQIMTERIAAFMDEMLRDLCGKINILCDDSQFDNGSLLFYRIFLSSSELQLLSKFNDVRQCKSLFLKSLANESNMETKINDQMENILLNIMTQEIKVYINNIHSLSVWTERPPKSEQLLNLPQFNLKPNEYIKRIGTHLLALVQQLESHENSMEEQEKEKEENENEEAETDTIDSEKWLNLVLKETVQTLFMEFYKLNGLSLKGTKQLISDLNYLCNIANAIYLDEPEFIYAVIGVLQCKLGNSNTLKQRLTQNINNEDNDNKKTQPKLRTSFQRKVATKFAVLRGLNVRFV